MLPTSNMCECFKTLQLLLVMVVVVGIKTTSAQVICPDATALHNVSAHFNYATTSYTEHDDSINFYQLENHTVIHVVRANVSVLCEGMVNSFRYLKNLALTNANITKIQPEAFKQVPRLTTLSLAVNHLTTVKREQFVNLHKLSVLYLSANKIDTIDEDAFADLLAIRKIYLDKNRIFEINSKWFLDNTKLGLINLAFNSISKIQAGAFTLARKNSSLEVRLQHNAIEELVPKAVVCNEIIKDLTRPNLVLRMDFNTLTHIPAGFIKTLSNFTGVVTLNSNVVKCVTSDVLEELKNNTSIELQLNNNPLDCPCMQDITNFLNENTVQATFKYTSTYECFLYGVQPPPEWD